MLDKEQQTRTIDASGTVFANSAGTYWPEGHILRLCVPRPLNADSETYTKHASTWSTVHYGVTGMHAALLPTTYCCLLESMYCRYFYCPYFPTTWLPHLHVQRMATTAS
jgi:hypothetical protein